MRRANNATAPCTHPTPLLPTPTWAGVNIIKSINQSFLCMWPAKMMRAHDPRSKWTIGGVLRLISSRWNFAHGTEFPFVFRVLKLVPHESSQDDAPWWQSLYKWSGFPIKDFRNVTLAVVDSIKERCLQWIGRDCWRMRLEDNINPR